MSACLLLVDVENLRPVGSRSWSWAPPEPLSNRKCHCLIDRVVVVLGLATKMASRQFFEDQANIKRIAADSTSAIGVHTATCSVEVFMTLAAPEAADRALMQALRVSPDIAGRGPFKHVALLSRDHGLEREIGKALGNWKKPGDSTFEFTMALWCLEESKQLNRAAATASAVVGSGEAVHPSQNPILFVNKKNLADWASGQSVQVSGSLAQIARSVSMNPALLTQVGPTIRKNKKPCARGVARLGSILGNPGITPVIGACYPGDGLEMEIPGQSIDSSVAVQSVEDSPLGNGAVRVRLTNGQTATVRTELPPGLVKRSVASRSVPIHFGSKYLLDDEKSLLLWDRHVSFTGPSCRVSFCKGNPVRGSFCEMEQHGELPHAWWFWKETDNYVVTTIKPALPSFMVLPKSTEDIPCHPVVVRSPQNRPALGWRIDDSIFQTNIKLDTSITNGAIGIGRWKGTNGSNNAAMILCLEDVRNDQPIQGGSLRAIQDLRGWYSARPHVESSIPEMNAGSWFRLSLLPIVVAGWPS